MEGRDIGSVVLPEAEVKVFLTASPEERVRRRQEELAAIGITRETDTLALEIAERDQRDSGRDSSPMVRAADAVLLDSDQMSADEVVTEILKMTREAERAYGR